MELRSYLEQTRHLRHDFRQHLHVIAGLNEAKKYDKLTAYLASVVGAPGLCKLIDGLGGAFGLILGMTGGCALLLLISVLASVGAVMP